jgi:hypothetical protein
LKTPWGHFWHLVNFDRERMDRYTLADCAAREFRAIEAMLRQAFPSKFAIQYQAATTYTSHA